MKNALYVLLGVMAGFVLAGLLVFVSRAPQGEPIILQPAPTKAPLAVHVVGAVPRPGLYEFAEGARVQDAIDAAGGMLAEANIGALNLAQLLEDGQQLDIPYIGGVAPTEGSDQPELPSSNNNSGEDLININTATLAELDTIPNVGQATAQKIIDNRPFSSIDALQTGYGFSSTEWEIVKVMITVGD